MKGDRELLPKVIVMKSTKAQLKRMKLFHRIRVFYGYWVQQTYLI